MLERRLPRLRPQSLANKRSADLLRLLTVPILSSSFPSSWRPMIYWWLSTSRFWCVSTVITFSNWAGPSFFSTWSSSSGILRARTSHGDRSSADRAFPTHFRRGSHSNTARLRASRGIERLNLLPVQHGRQIVSTGARAESKAANDSTGSQALEVVFNQHRTHILLSIDFSVALLAATLSAVAMSQNRCSGHQECVV